MKGLKKKKLKLLKLSVFLLVIIVAGAILLTDRKVSAPEPQENAAIETDNTSQDPRKGFKIFTGKEFTELYNSFFYPNTQLINEKTPITGNKKADKNLRKVALARGYKIRSAPVTDAFIEVQKDMLLQQKAAKPWKDLQRQAQKDGLILELTDAFRSAEDQKTIFLNRIKYIPIESIARGTANTQINEVLAKTALPGYSRHHTGYTIDIACINDPNVKFENSVCFKWLSKNNYQNAKKHGWIPSYPKSAGKQGPDPEAWEYVWVGTEVLK